MKIVTITIEGTANKIRMPWPVNHGSNHPPSPNSTTAISPTITGDTARGRSTSALIKALPGKRSRAITSATITPKTDVTITVMTVMTPVR